MLYVFQLLSQSLNCIFSYFLYKNLAIAKAKEILALWTDSENLAPKSKKLHDIRLHLLILSYKYPK